MAFKNDLIFPAIFSLDMESVDIFRSEDVQALSGDIYANEKWKYPRKRMRLRWGPKSRTEIDQFYAFWLNVRTLHTFRVSDPIDNKSNAYDAGAVTDSDQVIGVGDGATAVFDLVKGYTFGSETFYRRIYAPIDGTLVVSVNGVGQIEGVDYSVDYTTGVITFSNIPANTHIVRAGYEYHLKCRFVNNELARRFMTLHIGDVEIFTLLENPR